MTEPVHVVIHQLRSGDVILALGLGLLATWGLCQALLFTRVTKRGRLTRKLSGLTWQLGALLCLEQAYEYTRGEIPQKTDIALLHAYRVLDLEWSHGFFVEQRLEHFFLQFRMLMDAIDIFYILCHAVVTVGVLILIYVLREEQYPFARNMFIVTTSLALVAFYVYPMAPPRMLPNYGFVDPTQLFHLVAEGGAQPGSYTYNPYAAMPSLHVGYALVIGWSAFRAFHLIWVRILAVLYPVAMAAAVVISGNHWLLDVAGAVVTVLLARAILFALIWSQWAARAASFRLSNEIQGRRPREA